VRNELDWKLRIKKKIQHRRPFHFRGELHHRNALPGSLHGVMSYVDAVKRFMGVAQRAG
jgi:hypothetical protein